MTRGLRILIVEDDALIAMDLEDELSDLGYEPVRTSTVSKARLALEEEAPAFAVLDMHLKSETSFDLANDLRARDIPFLFLSGNDVSALPENLRTSTVLTKPIHLEKLAEAIIGATEAS